MTPPVQAERRRTAGLLAAVAVSLWALGGVPAGAFEGGWVSPSWQPAAAGTRAAATRLAAEQPAAPSTRPGVEPAAETPRAERGEGETEHSESPWGWVARLFNFAILIAGLVYLLRSPLLEHLDRRGVDVRSALTRAAGLRAEAGSQVAQIDARMKALPAEIEALKRRGAEEIAAEEARIRALAESERQRLLDQARRGIETELRVAERDLKKRAGELAVALATERVKRTIGEQDQARLVDRYVAQMRH